MSVFPYIIRYSITQTMDAILLIDDIGSFYFLRPLSKNMDLINFIDDLGILLIYNPLRYWIFPALVAFVSVFEI